MNISSAGISRLLNEAQTEIKLAVLDALCNALECSPNELLVQTVVNYLNGERRSKERMILRIS